MHTQCIVTYSICQGGIVELDSNGWVISGVHMREPITPTLRRQHADHVLQRSSLRYILGCGNAESLLFLADEHHLCRKPRKRIVYMNEKPHLVPCGSL